MKLAKTYHLAVDFEAITTTPVPLNNFVFSLLFLPFGDDAMLGDGEEGRKTEEEHLLIAVLGVCMCAGRT